MKNLAIQKRNKRLKFPTFPTQYYFDLDDYKFPDNL